MSSISHCNRKWIRTQKYWCRVCLSSDREHVHVWLQRPVCERESVPQSCLCLPLAGVGGLTQTARPLSKSKWYVCRLDCSDSLFPPDRKLITDVHLLLYYIVPIILTVRSRFIWIAGLTDIVSLVAHSCISLSPLRVFGFVAKKPGSVAENVCHLFAELDPEQPATAIINFINKVMLAPQRR